MFGPMFEGASINLPQGKTMPGSNWVAMGDGLSSPLRRIQDTRLWRRRRCRALLPGFGQETGGFTGLRPAFRYRRPREMLRKRLTQKGYLLCAGGNPFDRFIMSLTRRKLFNIAG